jgi:hypothetical protein
MASNLSWYAPRINGHVYTKQEDDSIGVMESGIGYVDKKVLANGIVVDGIQIVTPEEYLHDLPALGVKTAMPVDSRFLAAMNDPTKYVARLSSAEMDKIRLPTAAYGIVDEDSYNNGIPYEDISRKQFRADLNSLGLVGYTLVPSDIFAANNSRDSFRPGFPEASPSSQ